MASSTSPPVSMGFSCSVCTSSFRRQEHLQRHFLIHGAERPFPCPICKQAFKRRDAMKRHLRTCKARLEANIEMPVLPQQEKGKKRKACDRCFQLKRACDFKYPCETCSERNEQCSYERVVQKDLEVASSRSRGSWPDCDNELVPALEPEPDPVPNLDDWQEVNIDMPAIDDILVAYRESSWGSGRFLQQPYHDLSVDLDVDPFHETAENEIPSQSDSHLDDSSISRLVHNPASAFPFLTKFIQYQGLLESFECGSLVQRQDLMNLLPPQGSPARKNHLLDLERWFVGNVMDMPTMDSPPEAAPSGGVGLSDSTARSVGAETQQAFQYTQISQMGTTRSDGEVGMAQDSVATQPFPTSSTGIQNSDQSFVIEIVRMIKDVTLTKPRGSRITLDWSPPVEEACFQFFSLLSLRKFLLLFWSCWYPNCPIIHKPTFVAGARSAALVASMALLGACVSPDPADRIRASVWFNSLEEVVFSDEAIQEEALDTFNGSIHDDPKVWRKLDAIQAAFHICVLQNWEGSPESKRRIRQYRYTTMITIARQFGLENATLESLPLGNISEFKWRDFAVLETLIRTVTYIFLIDSDFVIFHNSPPRIMLPELQIDLTCPDACFQAESADLCFTLLCSWAGSRRKQPNLSVLGAVERICRDTDGNMDVFQNLSILNMFTIVAAIHTLLFNVQTSWASTSTVQSAELGLTRWSWAWNNGTYLNELSFRNFPLREDMWKRVGFVQHAQEFCLLARVMLVRLKQQGDSNYEPLDPCPNDSGRKSRSKKFDEGNMNQVTQLIKEFQDLSVSQLQYPWL